MDDTLWKDENLKRKPVNKQAALILSRPAWIHLPPSEPIIVETSAQRIAREQSELSERVAVIKKDQAERAVQVAEREKERKQRRAKKKPMVKNLWLAKHEKKMAKLRGEKPPSNDELRAKRLALPSTGKTI